MTRISVVSSWLCATGVVVVSSYCILTHFKNTPADQKKAAALVERINKRGTVSEAEYGRQRAELGKATDPARASEYSRTGINYFTVNLRGNAEVIPAHVMVSAYPGLHDLDIPLAVERVAASIS